MVRQELDKAIALHNQGRLIEAGKLCEEVLQRDKANADALNLLGLVRFQTRNYAEAERLFFEAARHNPKGAAFHANRGNALKQLGHLDEALSSYERAIALNDKDAVAHANRAITLHRLGRFDEALAGYDRAIGLAPAHAEAYSNRGIVLKELNRPDEALASFGKAVSVRPNYAMAHYNCGVLQGELRRLDEALASYDRAIALKPDYADAYFNRGNILAEQGNVAAALDSYRTALRIRPAHAECYRNYASITKFKPDDPLLAQMRALVAAGRLPPADLAHLHFAIGKAEADLGNSDVSIKHLIHGNAGRKNELGYDITRDADLFSAIKAYFASDDAGDRPKPDSGAGVTPVFILGMPRSGTTLVEQIVASHSGAFGAGELMLLQEAVDGSGWRSGAPRRQVFDSTRSFYLPKLAAMADAPLITDKMPLNFRWIGFIREALPEARIVHLIRDPAAVCWSNFKTYFPSTGMGFTFDQEDIAHYYKLYEDLMAFWHARYPGAIYDLDYEKLTEHQEPETRKLLAYLGLGWEDSVLKFHETRRAVSTASTTQVRKGMYQGSSQEWKKYQTWLQPMLDILNRRHAA